MGLTQTLTSIAATFTIVAAAIAVPADAENVTPSAEQIPPALQSAIAPESASPGDPVMWNLTPTNPTRIDAAAEVTATIPDGVEAQTASGAPGWSLEYTLDGGTTWTGTLPPEGLPAVTGVRASGNMAGTQGAVGALNPLESTTAVQISGGGDGFNAVFYNKNLWLVNHHARAGSSEYGEWLKCFDKQTGDPCPGLNNGATFIPAEAGAPFGTGPQQFDTPNASVAHIDQATGRIYAPVQYATSPTDTSPVGWVCGDLNTLTSCGFIEAGTEQLPQDFGGKQLFTQFNPTNPVNVTVEGVPGTRTRLYAVGGSGDVYCLDVADENLCPSPGVPNVGGPVTLPAGNLMVQTSATPNTSQTSGVQATLRVYTVHATSPTEWVLQCADMGTGDPCWAPKTLPNTFPSATSTAYSQPQVMFNTAGATAGVCTMEMGGWTEPVWHCYNQDGDPDAALAATIGNATPDGPATFGGRHLPTLPFDDNFLYSLMMYSHQVGDKLYIPWVLWPGRDAAEAVNTVTCLDFSTGQACAGFDGLEGPYLENVLYTISSDDLDNNCLWWSGDKGNLESFNATTGRSGCPWQSGSILTAAPQSCTATDTLNYTTVTAPGLPKGVTVEVNIFDKNGDPVPPAGDSPNTIVDPEGFVDISNIPIAGDTSTIEVHLRAFADNDTPLDGVTAVVGWDATPVLCTQISPLPVCESGTSISLPSSLRLTAPGMSETYPAASQMGVIRGLNDCTVELTKTIGGVNYPETPGFPQEPGGPVDYQFSVATPGQFSLGTPVLTDDNTTPGEPSDDITPQYVGGDTNSNGRLDPGETWQYVYGTKARTPGTYTNTATATVPGATNGPLTDQAVYTSADNRIVLDKLTNSEQNGGEVAAGDKVTWTYVVTNSSPVTLDNITLADDREGEVTCPQGSLAPGAQMMCTADGETVTGDYTNEATVTGRSPLGVQVEASDVSGYTGLAPAIEVNKTVNGGGNLDSAGAARYKATAGEKLTYRFDVTNIGNATLGQLMVTDRYDNRDVFIPVACPKAELAPGESMTCESGSVAFPGVEDDTVTATGVGLFSGGEQLTYRDGSQVPAVSDTSRAGYTADNTPQPTPSPTVTPADPTTPPQPTPAPTQPTPAAQTPIPAVLPTYSPPPAAADATPAAQSGALAQTGGSALWALWAGLGLIVVGGAAVAATRIRG